MKVVKSESGRPIRRIYDSFEEYYEHQLVHDLPHKRKDFAVDRVKTIAIKEFANKVKRGMILDAGCRNGYLIKELPADKYTVYGIDMLKEFKQFYKDPKLFCAGDLHSLPYEDNFFDAIYCRHSLEHLHTPEDFVEEASRTLKPNGLIFVIVPREPKLGGTHASCFPTAVSLKECLETSMKVLSSISNKPVKKEIWAWAQKIV